VAGGLRRLTLAGLASRRADAPGFDRLAGLDGLRAVAALAVFAHHVGFASGATFNSRLGGLLARLDIGVPVFFALSGFLLFRPVAASVIDGRPLRRARDHLARRALRVYPAFWAALLLITAVTSESFRDIGAAATTALLVHIHWPDHLIGPMPQAWSLATEISFYALLPLLARLIRPLISGSGAPRARRDRIVGLLACTAALYLVSVFFRLWLHGLGTGADWTGVALLWLPAQIDYFAIGMGLAVAHIGCRPGSLARVRLDRWASPAGWWWLAGVVLFVLVAQKLGLARGLAVAAWPREMLRQLLYGAVGFTLLFPLVFGAAGPRPGRSLVRRVVSGRVLTALGTVSYSFYLWHMVFIVHPWQQAERAVERIWDATVRSGWFDALAGWTGIVGLVDSRFMVLAATALVPTLAVSAVSYWLVERLGVAAGRRHNSPTIDPTPTERFAARAVGWWRTASFRAQIAAIAALAACVRFGYVLTAKRTETLDPDSVFPGDQFYYALAGDALADGRGFVVPWHHISVSAADRVASEPLEHGLAAQAAALAAPHAADHPPLTALAAAPAGFLPGPPGSHVLEQRLTMAALGVVAVVLIGLLGRAVAGRAVGLAAAGLAAVYAGLWVNDALVMSETLVAVTTAGALWAAVRYRRAPSLWVIAELGAWLGAAVLTRAELVLLFPLIVVPLVWACHSSWRTRLAQAAVAAAVAVGLCAPWVAANLVRFNEPVLLSTNVGTTLAGANNPQTYRGDSIGLWTLEHAEATVDIDGLDQSEVSSAYTSAAADFALGHPERWPAVVAARVGRVWSIYRPLQMAGYNQGEGREVWASLLALGGYLVLAPAAACGFLILRRNRREVVLGSSARLVPCREVALADGGEPGEAALGSSARLVPARLGSCRLDMWLLAAPFVHVTLVAAAFYGLVRLRVPAEVALVVLAAVALTSVRSCRRALTSS